MFLRLSQDAQDLATANTRNELQLTARDFFDEVKRYAQSPAYKIRLKHKNFVSNARLQASLTSLIKELDEAAKDESLSPERRSDAMSVSRRANDRSNKINEACALTHQKNNVYFIEVENNSTRLCSRMIDVSGWLGDGLFAETPTTCMTSATLTERETFEFIRRETGVPQKAYEVIAENPFHFFSQALLIVPDKLPKPNDARFSTEVAKVFDQVIKLCSGRTLGLFTSYKNLNAVHEKLSSTEFTVLKQGTASRTELVEQFKTDVSSVLLGTSSFWTGIDVPGEALTAVVIDKLPFPMPNDPIMDALNESSDCFDRQMIPRAIIKLRQGVGRLIRRRDDMGVVVITDPRIMSAVYGRQFLDSLPRMRKVRDINLIPRFFVYAKGQIEKFRATVALTG